MKTVRFLFLKLWGVKVFRFAFFGGTLAILSAILMYVFEEQVHLGNRVAYFYQTIITYMLQFVLNAVFTFANNTTSAKKNLKKILPYIPIKVALWGLSQGVFAIWISFHIHYQMANVLTIGTIMVLNYIVFERMFEKTNVIKKGPEEEVQYKLVRLKTKNQEKFQRTFKFPLESCWDVEKGINTGLLLKLLPRESPAKESVYVFMNYHYGWKALLFYFVLDLQCHLASIVDYNRKESFSVANLILYWKQYLEELLWYLDILFRDIILDKRIWDKRAAA